MSDIEEALDNLVDAILDSEIYENYAKAKKELSGYPELKEKVDEFRMKNFELQNSQLDGTRLMEEEDKFEREYENFRSNPIVNRFLAAELALIRMMQKVYGEITDSIEFE